MRSFKEQLRIRPTEELWNKQCKQSREETAMMTSEKVAGEELQMQKGSQDDVASNGFVTTLEERLQQRSDEMEELHMEAAINAAIGDEGVSEEAQAVDDAVVPNCLSPYVPTKAAHIRALLQFADVTGADTMLDIGCGDGRVCIVASKLSGCKSIGLDVSPLCIDMARDVANEEGLSPNHCRFEQVDATADPDDVLKLRKADAIESSDPSHTTDFAEMQISQVLRNVTVVYLFTFPTLLIKLVPLLAKMESVGRLRCVVTQTYHLPAETATVSKVDAEFDFKMYDSIAS